MFYCLYSILLSKIILTLKIEALHPFFLFRSDTGILILGPCYLIPAGNNHSCLYQTICFSLTGGFHTVEQISLIVTARFTSEGVIIHPVKATFKMNKKRVLGDSRA